MPVLIAPRCAPKVRRPADAPIRRVIPLGPATGRTTLGTLRTGWHVFENVVVGATDSAGATRAVRRAIEVARASGGTCTS